MDKIILKSEFLHGLIWWYYNDEPVSSLELPDFLISDKELINLNNKFEELYSSAYEFDSNNMPYYFNEEYIKKNKKIFIELITKIKKILERKQAINKFEIIDQVSDYFTNK